MDFIEELKWRGMLHQATEGSEAHLRQTRRTGYIGFDPTAPSLTIGNYVQVMILTLFQRSGHQPIVLMGGATGLIGDPSGKDKERDLKTVEELELNTQQQEKQFRRLLHFDEGPNPAILLNNYDFYKDMNVLDFLRKVGKSITVNYMLSKESVARRMESGISFTEFSYQLLQAYDFMCLFQRFGCTVQMGGSDQWGNITTGTEFIRRNLGEKAYAITTPLLTRSDGKKFGKSEEGNIWLDPTLTSPYRFYQFWINCDDRDLPSLIRYFTLRSREEVEADEASLSAQEQKRKLAEELTRRIHSDEAYESVLRVSQLLFDPRFSRQSLLALGKAELETVAEEIPRYEVPLDAIRNRVTLIELLSDLTGILPSRSEARRAIQGNAIAVNKEKVASLEHAISSEDLLHGKFLFIEKGKKNKYMIVAK